METKIVPPLQKRKSRIESLKETDFDVVIIGGGITGAGIALDAASRGLKTALFDKNDFCSGTSGKSTKLIHGGLRYLENLQFSLVRKMGHEREIIWRNAAHLVFAAPILFPLVKKGKFSKFGLGLALWMYEKLTGISSERKHKFLNKKETVEKEPLLNSPGLKGAGMYYEYKTSDSRLVIEILKKASELGAVILNYAGISGFIMEDNNVAGVLVSDFLSGQNFTVKSKFIVNASGPWLDLTRFYENPNVAKKLFLSKGIHIVVDQKSFPLHFACYFDAPDKRLVFAIPRSNKVYIGTTDTYYSGDNSDVEISDVEIHYLLNSVNERFACSKLGIDQVESVWAGLRPLIWKKGKKPGDLSRKDKIFVEKSGLISVAGGKLTGYRLMAKKVVNHITKCMGVKKEKNCITRDLPVSGANFKFDPKLHNLIEYCDSRFDEAKQTGIDAFAFKKLFYRYGTNIEIITEKVYELLPNAKGADVWIKAETWYAVNYEMCLTLSDFLIRRTEAIYFDPKFVRKHLDEIACFMAEYLEWDSMTKEKELNLFKEICLKHHRVHF